MKKKIYILSILIIVIAVAAVLFMCWNNQKSKSVESTATEEETDKEISGIEITEADAMDDDYGTETAEKDAEMSQKKMIPISCMDEEGEEVELTWDEIEEEIEKGNYNKEIVNVDKIQKLYVAAADDCWEQLQIAIDFEEAGVYKHVYQYLNEGPDETMSDIDMQAVKEILKDYIYEWEYEYDASIPDDDLYRCNVDSGYYYEMIIVDEYGRIGVYKGANKIPCNFKYFVNEMQPYSLRRWD